MLETPFALRPIRAWCSETAVTVQSKGIENRDRFGHRNIAASHEWRNGASNYTYLTGFKCLAHCSHAQNNPALISRAGSLRGDHGEVTIKTPDSPLLRSEVRISAFILVRFLLLKMSYTDSYHIAESRKLFALKRLRENQNRVKQGTCMRLEFSTTLSRIRSIKAKIMKISHAYVTQNIL